jgi:hypothetical protein
MKKQAGYTITELAVVLLAVVGLAGVGGWIANIVKLAGMGFDAITGMLVLRVVGVFLAPLGAVLGFF